MPHYELVIEGKQGVNDMLNVIHYADVGATPPDFSDVAAVFEGHITDHLQNICQNRTTWIGLTIREDIPGGVGTFVPFPGGTLTGLHGGNSHADYNSMLVRKVTGSLIKPTLGWAQQGGITAEGIDGNGAWGSTFVAAVQAFWEDIRVLNIAGPATWTMVVKARNPTAPNTQAYTAVSSISIQNTARPIESRRPLQGS